MGTRVLALLEPWCEPILGSPRTTTRRLVAGAKARRRRVAAFWGGARQVCRESPIWIRTGVLAALEPWCINRFSEKIIYEYIKTYMIFHLRIDI